MSSISSNPIKHLGKIDSSSSTDEELINPMAIDKCVSRSLVGDFVKGQLQSKFTRSLLFVAAVLSVFFVIMIHKLGIMPPCWMVTSVAVGSYVLGILFQLPFLDGLQKFRSEIATLKRLSRTNYNKIITIPDKGALYLGALPNRLKSNGETLVGKEQIGAVLSINEPWERSPFGLSLPYIADDWRELGIEYMEMDVQDHTLLDDDTLETAANFIHLELNAGRNVYVHCRAGVGRSAMAVAAYLIRYRNMTVDEAADLIMTHRPCSTIMKKLSRLDEYRERYVEKTHSKTYKLDEINKFLKVKHFLTGKDTLTGLKVIIAKDDKGKLQIIKNELDTLLPLLQENNYSFYRKHDILVECKL